MTTTQQIHSVALYARVSTRDGRQDTENQLAQLRDYCRKRGWSSSARTTGSLKRNLESTLLAIATTSATCESSWRH